MINTAFIARLTLAVGSLSLAGCNAPAEAPQPQPQAAQPVAETTAIAVKSPVSIDAEMVRLVDHAAHQLWDVEKEGMAPKTDADWQNVVERGCPGCC